jgi:cardiolipin synthase
MKVSKINTHMHKASVNPDFNYVKIKTETNTFGIFKLGFTMLIILIQVALILLIHFFFISLTEYYFIFSAIMSIVTCIYILSSDRNSYSKAVWIMFVLIFFLFGYYIFFLSDEKVFFRGSRKRYDKIFEDTNSLELQTIKKPSGDVDAVKICNYLNCSGGFGTYSTQGMKYYSSGTELFDAILENLEKAEKFVFMEYFIISDGVLLTRFLDVLKRKIKEGVEVKLIFDDMGSHTTISRKTKKKMQQMGIEIGLFNPLISKLSMAINYRDHRKILVVDGKVAFTGGVNLADEYVNEKRMHGYWKDSGIKVEGSAVDEFSLMFLRQWSFVSGKEVEYEKYINLFESKPKKNGSFVVPYADGLDYKNSIAKGTYLNLIASAKQKICIMTPYFILDDTLTNLLICKAQAGVEIQIVLPDVADKKIVYIVSRSNAEKLLEHGIKLYVMNDSFVHSKVILTDVGCVVGSINFDLRSFYQQFECAVFTNDDGVMKDIKSDFAATIKESTEITMKNRRQNKLINKVLAGILRLVSPFM